MVCAIRILIEVKLTHECRDINSYTKANTTIEPTTTFRGHTSVVGVCSQFFAQSFEAHIKATQDVDWHATDENLFTSVGDDKMMMMYVVFPMHIVSMLICYRWDKRNPSSPAIKEQAHEQEILAVAFSPSTPHLIITGSADKVSDPSIKLCECL